MSDDAVQQGAGRDRVFVPVTVEVATKDGPMSVPGLAHPEFPGLAITMLAFGWFTLTHRATGRKILGPFERAGSCALELVQWGACFDWSEGAPTIGAQLETCGDDPVPFSGATMTGGGEKRPMTKREMVQCRPILGDEFPWESNSDGPWAHAERAIGEVRKARGLDPAPTIASVTDPGHHDR